MKFYEKNLYAKVTALLAAAYLLTFTVYYLGNYIITSNDIFLYIDIILNKLTYLLLPIASGVITLVRGTYNGTRGAFVRLIPLSLARLVYFIPYFYLVFIASGLDSIDSILFSALMSVADAAVAYVLSAAVFFILKFIISKRLGNGSVGEALRKRTMTDFSDPVSFAISMICAFVSLYFLAGEIYDTVNFLINYGLSFTAPEIFYTVISYVLDFALFFIHYYIIAAIKNKLIKNRLSEDSVIE